jgi:hypothetical protein
MLCLGSHGQGARLSAVSREFPAPRRRCGCSALSGCEPVRDRILRRLRARPVESVKGGLGQRRPACPNRCALGGLVESVKGGLGQQPPQVRDADPWPTGRRSGPCCDALVASYCRSRAVVASEFAALGTLTKWLFQRLWLKPARQTTPLSLVRPCSHAQPRAGDDHLLPPSGSPRPVSRADPWPDREGRAISHTAARRAVAGLNRRARHGAVGTEHAAIARFRLEESAARPAVVEELTGVGRHRLRRTMTAIRAEDRGCEDGRPVRHRRSPPTTAPRRSKARLG